MHQTYITPDKPAPGYTCGPSGYHPGGVIDKVTAPSQRRHAPRHPPAAGGRRPAVPSAPRRSEVGLEMPDRVRLRRDGNGRDRHRRDRHKRDRHRRDGHRRDGNRRDRQRRDRHRRDRHRRDGHRRDGHRRDGLGRNVFQSLSTSHSSFMYPLSGFHPFSYFSTSFHFPAACLIPLSLFCCFPHGAGREREAVSTSVSTQYTRRPSGLVRPLPPYRAARLSLSTSSRQPEPLNRQPRERLTVTAETASQQTAGRRQTKTSCSPGQRSRISSVYSGRPHDRPVRSHARDAPSAPLQPDASADNEQPLKPCRILGGRVRLGAGSRWASPR